MTSTWRERIESGLAWRTPSWIASISPRSTESGVRSSWEMSAIQLRRACSVFSSESARVLKSWASCPSSSSGPMATLVANTVPLVQCIAISAATLNNRTIARTLAGVIDGVKRGEGIAAPIRKAGVFPPLAAHLLAVGEETGRIDQMFARMADIYDNDTRVAIRRFTSVFEPVVILVMGVMVGALILSMLLAITSINEVAG